MKKLIFLLLSIIATAQNPITVPSVRKAVNENQDFQNKSGVYNTTLFNVNFRPLTTTQINAITTPKDGQIVYNTTTKTNWFYNGTIWSEMGAGTGGGGGIALTDLSATAPLNYNNTTGNFSIPQATTTTSGFISNTDFTTFNSKQNAITITNNGNSGNATLIGSTLNIPNYGALWSSESVNPTATSNTGTLPRFVENTVNGSKWYIDRTGTAKIIENSTATAQIVYINAVSPIGATIFDTANPPVTNNNALKNQVNALYIGTDNSTWNSNGTTYSTYTVPSSTPFFLNSTTIDAGNNKTSLINRTGSVVVDNGFLRASSSSLNYTFTIDPTDPVGPKLKLGTPGNISQYFEMGAYNSVNNFDSKTRTFKIFNSNAANAFNILNTNGNVGLGTATPLKALHVQAGGTSLLTTAFGSGMIFSTNDASGSRIFLEHLGAGTNLKSSSIYTQNGISYFGAVLNDSGSTWVFANPLTVNHTTGFVGINTTSPLSNFEINGSFGANIISTGASTYTLLSSDYTVVLTTSGAVVTLGTSVAKRIVNIKNASTGNITITGHIENVANNTLTIPSGQSRTLHGNGTTWWII